MNAAQPQKFINRELSWLEFNRRVLEEAQDPLNPLLDRLRFYCIFHSNLDEFFMVRVASIHRLIEEGNLSADPAGLTPHEQLEAVLAKARALREVSSRLYQEELMPALAREQIRILHAGELSPSQQKHLDWYFESEVYPVLTPTAIDEADPFPHLPNLTLNLAALLRSSKRPDAGTRLAIVQVPGRMPGLTRLPDGGALLYCWLSDVIRDRLAALFLGYEILEVASFRLTRDAQVELDDEGWHDYVRMLESELRKRQRARPMRLEYEEKMSPGLLQRIQQGLGVDDAVLMPVRGPLDPRPLLSLADMPGYEKLHYWPQPPLAPAVLAEERGIFDIIREGDILLHHPYDSFDPVIEFLQTAAEDADVLAIKQTLYRSSGAGSPVLDALIQAAEKGKAVTVLVELTARFDEERNIGWARDLEQAGVHVLYGLAGLKAHAKIALVVRREPEGIRRYVHLGTGNYNERTARLYTDFGLLTAADDIGRDASGFFNAITGYSEPPMFNRLIMAPIGMRESILALIRREADRARSGQRSAIHAKMNSLVDRAIIEELYAASAAGVPIRLNVRGICCLRPGVPGLSDNIRVVSIIDRYLEHSRAFVFHNGGDTEVYVSSADWMPRNLDRRVELMFPLLQKAPRERAIQAIEAQFADDQKARLLLPDGSYERIRPGVAEPVRVQEHLYQVLLKEREQISSSPPVRFVPLERKES
ncbi:MAG: polyphosphate kinase 1 [Acidobacteriota bacterium]|jgi:polyphosphate kinase